MLAPRLRLLFKATFAQQLPPSLLLGTTAELSLGFDSLLSRISVHSNDEFSRPELSIAGVGVSIPLTQEEPENELNWTGILFAAPKRKTTPSKKKMRSRHKQLKARTDLVSCKACGRRHPRHHLCPFCHPFNKWTTGKDGGLDRIPLE